MGELGALIAEADQLTDALAQKQKNQRKDKAKAQTELDAIDKLRANARAKKREAIQTIQAFHHRLCTVLVLDPACGSGNFLYVTLAHLKRLEGEVLNLLESLDAGQMWSHYGEKYKGFCLEFDTSHPPFEKIMRVKYSTEMPRIDVATLRIRRDFEAVMDLFSIKSTSWAYEREWRVLHAKADTPYHCPAECLTGIYFGPEISSEALEIIRFVLQGQNPHVKFWKGLRSKTDFKVQFEEFAYTPYLKKSAD